MPLSTPGRRPRKSTSVWILVLLHSIGILDEERPDCVSSQSGPDRTPCLERMSCPIPSYPNVKILAISENGTENPTPRTARNALQRFTNIEGCIQRRQGSDRSDTIRPTEM